MLSLIKSWHHPNKKYICLKANCFFDLIKCWWHKFSKFCESNSRWAYNLWRPPCGDIIKIRKLIYIQILISSVYLLNCWWNGFQMITWSGWCFLREDVIRIKKNHVSLNADFFWSLEQLLWDEFQGFCGNSHHWANSHANVYCIIASSK